MSAKLRATAQSRSEGWSRISAEIGRCADGHITLLALERWLITAGLGLCSINRKELVLVCETLEAVSTYQNGDLDADTLWQRLQGLATDSRSRCIPCFVCRTALHRDQGDCLVFQAGFQVIRVHTGRCARELLGELGGHLRKAEARYSTEGLRPRLKKEPANEVG